MLQTVFASIGQLKNGKARSPQQYFVEPSRKEGRKEGNKLSPQGGQEGNKEQKGGGKERFKETRREARTEA